MRNLKRALSLALASVMLLGMMVVGTSAASYPDVDDNDNVEAIEVLNAVNVMIGDRGNFRPDAAVNRHEMATIMAKLVLGVETADNYVGTHPFTDVFPWADKYVAACYENGLVAGTSATTFGGNQPLTAVQAAAMMLRALGYKDLSVGATDWRAPVTAMANQIRLFNGVASNPSEQLTRNQVAQLALNTLKSPMVNLVDNTITWNSNEGQVVMASGGRQYIALSSREAYARAINRVESAGTSASQIGGWTVELGEHLYNGKLQLNDVTDDFKRPAREWEYDGKEIGTYIKEELLKFENVGEVTGKDLYDLLGKTVIDEYALSVALDGVTVPETVRNARTRNGFDGYDGDTKLGSKHNQEFVFDAADMNRNNKGSVGATGTGVLTQVFVDPTYDNGSGRLDGKVWIAVINTYLARAKQDYDTRREELLLDAYSVDKYNDEYVALPKSGLPQQIRLGVEDYPIVKDASEKDAFLVTFAEGEVQTIVPAEVMDAVTISSFKSKDNLVVDGTQYKFTATAGFDADALKVYTGGNVTNLKDTTYNVFLDAYGNTIGVQEVDAKKNYVFLAAIDINDSNLVNGIANAKAVFLDGTVDTIRVNLDKSTLDWYKSGARPGGYNKNSILNTWCTYTVNNSSVYTVKQVMDINAKGDSYVPGANNDTGLAQYHQDGFANDYKIDKKHITLRGTNAEGINNAYYRVYGNEKTVYLTAELGNLTNENGTWGVVKGVDTLTTAAENVNLTVWTDGQAVTEAENSSSPSVKLSEGNGFTKEDYATKGVYTLYDDDGIVIAAVVAGEDDGSARNLVYVHTGSIESETYNGSGSARAAGDGLWTWTRKVIKNGEEVTLTEVSDGNSELDKMQQYHWYQIKTNADGEVTGVYRLRDDNRITGDYATTAKHRSLAIANLDRYDDYALDYHYYDINNNGVQNLPDEIGEIAYTVQNGASTVLYWNENLITSRLRMNGRTLYVATDDQTGFIVNSNVKWVVQQWDNNKKETYIDDGTTAAGLKNMIDEVNRRYTNNENYTYQVSAVIESGIASSVVIYFNENDYNRPDTGISNDKAKIELDAGGRTWTLTIYTNKTLAQLTDDDIYNAFVDAGCTNVIKTRDGWTFTRNGRTYADQDVGISVDNSGSTTYTITVAGTANGTASVSKLTASAGETITVTATPDNDYELAGIAVNGSAITGTTFTMPATNVTVTVTFSKINTGDSVTPILGASAEDNAAAKAVTAKAADSKITVTGLPANGSLKAYVVVAGEIKDSTTADKTMDWPANAELWILKGKTTATVDPSGLLIPTTTFDETEITGAPKGYMARAARTGRSYVFVSRYLGWGTVKVGTDSYTIETVTVKFEDEDEPTTAYKLLRRDVDAANKSFAGVDLSNGLNVDLEWKDSTVPVELPSSEDIVEIPVNEDKEPVLEIVYTPDTTSSQENTAKLVIKAKEGVEETYKINGEIVTTEGMTPTESDTAEVVGSNDPLLTGLPFTLKENDGTAALVSNTIKVSDIQKNVKVEYDKDTKTFKVTGDVYYQDGMTAWETGEGKKGYFVAFDLDWSKLAEQVANDAKISVTYWAGTTETAKEVTNVDKKDILLSKVALATGEKLKNRGIQITSALKGITEYYTIDLSGLNCIAPELLKFDVTSKKETEESFGQKLSAIQTGVTVTTDEATKTVKLAGTLHPVTLTNWSSTTAWNKGYFAVIKIDGSAIAGTSVIVDNPNAKNKTMEGSFDTAQGEVVIRVADLAEAGKQAVTKGNITMLASNGSQRVTYTLDLSGLTLEKIGSGDVKLTEKTGALGEAYGNMPAANFQKDLKIERSGNTFKITGELTPVKFSSGFGSGDLSKGYYVWFDIDAGDIVGAKGWAVRGAVGGNCATPKDDFVFWLGGEDLENENMKTQKLYVVDDTSKMNTAPTAPTAANVLKEYTLDFSGVTLKKVADEPFTVETAAADLPQGLLCETNYNVTVDHTKKEIVVTGTLNPVSRYKTPWVIDELDPVFGEDADADKEGYHVTFSFKPNSTHTSFTVRTSGVTPKYGSEEGKNLMSGDTVDIRVAKLTDTKADAKGTFEFKLAGDTEWTVYKINVEGATFKALEDYTEPTRPS